MRGMETVTLWRPTGPKELALVEASEWRAWPPRLADQPIFYPVLNEDQQVGGATILEYWIPAEDLNGLNANIVGTIDVVAEYR
jgi:hypothetical protein